MTPNQKTNLKFTEQKYQKLENKCLPYFNKAKF